ncbi:MAG: rod shape-determining protein MreC [Thermodesulfovibrionaceae bacterium]
MFKKTTIIVSFLIVLLSFIFISCQVKNLISFPKFSILFLLYPIESVKSFISDIFTVKEENQKLKEELYQLKLQQKSIESLLEENIRLRALLQLKENKKEILTIAKVISKGFNSFSKTIWIDKGSAHGVKVNMPVINLEGLVGKVIYTSSNSSEVLLITDPNFSVSVRVERNQVEGVLSGDGNFCILKYIPKDEDIKVGDRLITSGLDGVFPEGIKVGVITNIERKKGFFQNIEVTPFQSDSKIKEVAIVKTSQ